MTAQTVTPAPAAVWDLHATLPLQTLLDALKRATFAVPARPPVPIVAGVRLTVLDGRLEIAGTDYNTSITTLAGDPNAESPVTGAAEGRIVVGHRFLVDLLTTLRGIGSNRNPLVTLDSTTRPGWLLVSANDWRWPVQQFPMAEYPQLPEVGLPTMSATGVDLASALRFVVEAASRDETLPILNSVYLAPSEHDANAVQLYATDRYRLIRATVAVEGGLPGPVLLQRRDVGQLVKVLSPGTWRFASAGTKLNERLAITDDAGTTVVVTPADGEYPKIAKLFGTGLDTVTLTRKSLLDAATLITKLSAQHVPAQLVVANGKAGTTVTLQPTGEGWDTADAPDGETGAKAPTIPAQVTGGAWGSTRRIHFNPYFLRQTIGAYTSDEITFGFTPGAPARKPMVIAANPDALNDPTGRAHLLMPVSTTSTPGEAS